MKSVFFLCILQSVHTFSVTFRQLSDVAHR